MKLSKVATIDIGSNAIRLLISNVFEIKGVKYHTKNSLYRVQLRLGDDSFKNGTLSEKNYGKLKSTLKSFKLILEINEIKKYLAYATSAMRNLNNGEKILMSLEKETGIKVEIISGKKESEIVAKNDIMIGEKFSENNVTSKRPGTGISPFKFQNYFD